MSSNTKVKINWLFRTQRSWDETSPSDTERAKNLKLIHKVFSSQSETLKHNKPTFTEKLMEADGLEITIGNAENAIDPDFLQGAGEISSQHSKHLVMLLLLEKEAKEQGRETELTLCDLKGELIPREGSISELFTLLEQFGFCKDDLRQYAEAVGLSEKAIDLSALNEVEQEDYFF